MPIRPARLCVPALLCLALVGNVALADTYQNYLNSTTRQQIERMDEAARANAKTPSNDRSAPTQYPRAELERLDAEARERKQAQAQAETLRMQELDRRLAEYARERAADRELRSGIYARTLAWRQDALRRHADSLVAASPEAPLRREDYDRLLEIAAPHAALMEPVMAAAFNAYPREFVVRLAFMRLSMCANIPTPELADGPYDYGGTAESVHEKTLCAMRQLPLAMPFLEASLGTRDPQDAALACAMLYAAQARPQSFYFAPRLAHEAMYERLRGWIAGKAARCDALVPAGSAWRVGLLEPLLEDIGKGRIPSAHTVNSTRINSPLWWALVSPATWRDVGAAPDADAVRAAYQHAVKAYRDWNQENHAGY